MFILLLSSYLRYKLPPQKNLKTSGKEKNKHIITSKLMILIFKAGKTNTNWGLFYILFHPYPKALLKQTAGTIPTIDLSLKEVFFFNNFVYICSSDHGCVYMVLGGGLCWWSVQMWLWRGQQRLLVSSVAFSLSGTVHCFILIGWPTNSGDLPLSFPSCWGYKHMQPCPALYVVTGDSN